MLKSLKQYLSDRRKRAYLEEYRRGYDWAAGALLREEETPASIEAYCYGQERRPFDAGADHAIEALLDLDVLTDDRV